jgi:CRISPR-associated protein Cas2
MLYLVSYDISDDRRRTKLAKKLKDFGDRVHYSVFECLLDPVLLDKMVTTITGIVDEEHDSVRIYALCANCEKAVEIIGTGELTENKDIYVV